MSLLGEPFIIIVISQEKGEAGSEPVIQSVH